MRIYLFLFFFSLITLQSLGQITKQDYDRAVSFLWGNINNKDVFNGHVMPIWFGDSSAVAYSLTSIDTISWYKMNLNNRIQVELFNHDRLAKAFNETLKLGVKSNNLPITSLIILNENRMELSHAGKTYVLELPEYKLTLKQPEVVNPLERVSPDKNWTAYLENYNLYIRNNNTGEKKQLSTSGFKDYEYGSSVGFADLMEGENGKRPDRLNIQWSPDSKWIQTYITDLRKGKKMYLLDWSVDTLFKPRLLSYYRGSPGDTDMVYATPVFFNVETGQEIKRDNAKNIHTIAARYQWTKKPGILIEQITKRGYQEVTINEFNVINNKTRQLYYETTETSIDNLSTQWVEEWNKLLIISDHNGWRQIYSVDASDAILKPITKGEYFVSGITNIDKIKKIIYFQAQGKEIGRNPYLANLYRVNLNGDELKLLTQENGFHNISISPDYKFFIDNYSWYNQPTATVLRSLSDGKIVKSISTATVDGLHKKNFSFPEMYSTIARDGRTPIYGLIWKPTNFDSKKKYPIIDDSYTGPHTSSVPLTFIGILSRQNQALAELGFIVVTIDGMGTAGRSKQFRSISYKNMGKNLLDHVIFIRDLAKKYSWIDTTRIGIFGHSAGGYDAGHALLEYPDFYKVGVASSADHDFRMEKDWWPEMYMGWPVDSTFHQVSNITMAPNLKGKLFITHGGLDDNVNPSATFKLAEALIKADKDFDMLIIPSQRHGYTGKYFDYFTKRKWNYFVEHLLQQEPIWDFSFRK